MKVIAYYSKDLKKRGPCVLSARNKLDYLIGALIANGENVSVVSLCDRSLVGRALEEEKEIAAGGFEVLYRRCTCRKNKIVERIGRLFSAFTRATIAFLKKKVENNETILLYHATNTLPILRFLKKKKNARIILEVEEIYGDVSHDAKLKKKEWKAFELADGFIFASELLNEKINTAKKPYAVAYGTYRAEADGIGSADRADAQDEVHCVYAGTFDPRKGGAAAAIAAAEFLPSNYHVHIIGFGSEKQKADLIAMISDVQQKAKARVTYDGLFAGKEYTDFIQSCDIGLSTQTPDGVYNDTSFPSKILSYLANGLRVVSVRIPVVERSEIGNLVSYYDKQDPREIAAAIDRVDFDAPFDGRGAIGKLDEGFKTRLKEVLEKVQG